MKLAHFSAAAWVMAGMLIGPALPGRTISGEAVFGEGSAWGAGVLNWQAGSRIVTTIAPGAPDYGPVHGTPIAGYSGVAGLLIQRGGGTSICTGSLVNSTTLLSAAHCFADGSGNLVATGAQAIFFTPSGTYVDTAVEFLLHPDYTGAVFDDHDVAVVRLSNRAPSNIDRYGIHYGESVGEPFETVGFGSRGQGNTGTTIPSGTLIRGFNSFDALGGDLLPFLGVTGADTVLMFDFDNGQPANDAFGFWLGPSFALPTLGPLESSTAPGDSGGPSFLANGKIAAVTSFGLTFTITLPNGTVFNSDILAGLNSSFGEFAGNTSMRENREWLTAVLVPEPGTWTMMGAGLAGLVWLSRRRRG